MILFVICNMLALNSFDFCCPDGWYVRCNIPISFSRLTRQPLKLMPKHVPLLTAAADMANKKYVRSVASSSTLKKHV